MKSFIESLFSFEGSVAGITGAGGHLCGEMARGLAQAGCKVAVMDIRLAKAETVAKQIVEDFGGDALPIELDATDKDSFRRGLALTLSEYGKVDILVNGAGTNSATPILDIEMDEFRSVMDSQLSSTFLGCQIFGEQMLSQGKGSIINISSASAGPPLSKAFTYSAAKAAILNLTQNLGREWATSGVRVYAIRPGFFPTDWNRKNFISEQRENAILGHTPMARYGEVSELVGGIIYLASDASSFVTGSELTVDGGFSCMTI